MPMATVSIKKQAGFALVAALTACLAGAPQVRAETNIWDFVADARANSEDAAVARQPAGAPRTVLPLALWQGLVDSAKPAAAQLAALIAPRAIGGERAKPKPANTPPKRLAAMPTPNPHPDASPAKSACGPDALGTARTVTLDTAGGPHFGRHDRYGDPYFLGPKEVVLTFDDGPRPKTTRRILKTLADHCIKATFFVIGKTAQWKPDILRETADAGHTIAAHTATHPIPFKRRSHAAAMREIDRGFTMVEDALGAPVAPFFRFPGLSYTRAMLDDLSARDVSAFSVDVISDDTAADATPNLIVSRTMTRLKRYGNGILLFHDTLNRTAAALPMLLKRLKAEGYSIVHLESARPYQAPDAAPSGRSTLVASAAPQAPDTAIEPRAPASSQSAATPRRRLAHAPLFKKPQPVALNAPSVSAIY